MEIDLGEGGRETWAQVLGTDPRKKLEFPIPSAIMLQILTTVHDLPRFHGINLLRKSDFFARTMMPLIYQPCPPQSYSLSCSNGGILVLGYIRIPKRVWFRLNYVGVVWGMENRFYDGFSLRYGTGIRCGWLPDPRGEKRCVTMCQLT